MSRTDCIEAARKEALKHRVTIAVVSDPIGTEDESGPYGYCPLMAWGTLFPQGVLDCWVASNGIVVPAHDESTMVRGRTYLLPNSWVLCLHER